jgi:aminoglycoside phosphotransferase (APT) family kinase protein
VLGGAAAVSTPDDAGDVERIRAALVPVLGSTEAGRLTLASSPMRRSRSTLYFLGMDGNDPAYVVKVPSLGSTAIDATDAVSSADQFRALTLAYRWLDEEDRHTAVRPVACLEELDAVVMEYVSGQPYRATLQRGVVAPEPARRAATAAGDALRRLHRHALEPQASVDLRSLADEVREAEAAALRPSGLRLPDQVQRVLDRVPARSVIQNRVLTHGDFAPTNLILIAPDEVAVLDPSLAEVGYPEDDLARFLAVVSSYSVFIPGSVLPVVRRRRRELEGAFRSGYGAAETATALMELRLLKQYALRWRRVRELSRLTRFRQLTRMRHRGVDLHLRTLVTECAGRLEALLRSDPVR